MSARRPPARYRRTRIRAQRARATMEPLPDVPAILEPLGDLGPLEDDVSADHYDRLAEATGHTAERYQAPEAAETARKRRMH